MKRFLKTVFFPSPVLTGPRSPRNVWAERPSLTIMR